MEWLIIIIFFKKKKKKKKKKKVKKVNKFKYIDTFVNIHLDRFK